MVGIVEALLVVVDVGGVCWWKWWCGEEESAYEVVAVA